MATVTVPGTPKAGNGITEIIPNFVFQAGCQASGRPSRSDGLPEKEEFPIIFVILLPGPGLPWGFILGTHGTLPTLATHGQARSRQAWLSRECVWGRGSVNPFTHPR